MTPEKLRALELYMEEDDRYDWLPKGHYDNPITKMLEHYRRIIKSYYKPQK